MFRSSDDMIFGGKIGGSEEPISSSTYLYLRVLVHTAVD